MKQITKKESDANYYFFQSARNKKAGPKAGFDIPDWRLKTISLISFPVQQEQQEPLHPQASRRPPQERPEQLWLPEQVPVPLPFSHKQQPPS